MVDDGSIDCSDDNHESSKKMLGKSRRHECNRRGAHIRILSDEYLDGFPNGA
jgi:hypothetical protein